MHALMNYRYPLLLILVLFLFKPTGAQNLFDSTHTARYADYLFLSGNYRLAIDEFERLHFIYKTSEQQSLRLIQSYRLNGNPESALSRMFNIWEQPSKVSQNVFKEYLVLQTISGNFDHVIQDVSMSNFLSGRESAFFKVSALMLDERYQDAGTLFQSLEVTSPALLSYREINGEALGGRFKSPLLSGLMSAVIPGSGKIYTTEWQDGLMSFAFVLGSAWQSYRGFQKHGINSPYGWIMGAISAGFYTGNIYGSVKSANKYNVQKRNNINLRVQAVFIHHTQ